MRNVFSIPIVLMALMSGACTTERVVYVQAPASTQQPNQATRAATYQAAAERQATEALHQENLRLATELEQQRLQAQLPVVIEQAPRVSATEAAISGVVAGAVIGAIVEHSYDRRGYRIDRGYSTRFGHPGWNPHFTLPTDRGYPASTRQSFGGRRR